MKSTHTHFANLEEWWVKDPFWHTEDWQGRTQAQHFATIFAPKDLPRLSYLSLLVGTVDSNDSEYEGFLSKMVLDSNITLGDVYREVIILNNLTDEQEAWHILLAGPSHPYYDETTTELLENFEYVFNGEKRRFSEDMGGIYSHLVMTDLEDSLAAIAEDHEFNEIYLPSDLVLTQSIIDELFIVEDINSNPYGIEFL